MLTDTQSLVMLLALAGDRCPLGVSPAAQDRSTNTRHQRCPKTAGTLNTKLAKAILAAAGQRPCYGVGKVMLVVAGQGHAGGGLAKATLWSG